MHKSIINNDLGMWMDGYRVFNKSQWIYKVLFTLCAIVFKFRGKRFAACFILTFFYLSKIFRSNSKTEHVTALHVKTFARSKPPEHNVAMNAVPAAGAVCCASRYTAVSAASAST